MNAPWDPNTPFETLIEQLEDAMEIVDAAGQAYTDAQVLTLAYTLVYNTGLYFDECKEWKAKPAADKTWDLFKNFFLQAQSELRQQQQATSACSGFSAYANDQETQIANALANLATAQAANQQAFCQLVTTNTDLAEQLKTALSDIASLKHLVQNKQSRNPNINKRRTTGSYCWTHRFRVADEHNSQNCKTPRDGHQKEANKNNLMGGSTAGQRN
jgi:hypothetical protein